MSGHPEDKFGLEAVRLPSQYRSVLLDWDAQLANAGALDIELEIEIVSVQLTRVALLLEDVDLAVRRATRFMSGSRALMPDGQIRPISTRIGGLLVVRVDIGSYKAKHKMQGQTAGFAQAHPITTGLLTGALVNTAFYFIPPLHQPAPPAGYQDGGMVIVQNGSETIELPASGLQIGISSAPKPKRADDPEMVITYSVTSPDGEQVTIRVSR